MKKCGSGGCGGSKCGCILVVVGALNWGLVGLGMFFGGDWNVVHMILGKVMWLEALVYVLVGLSGVMMLCGCMCKKCKNAQCDSKAPAENMGGGEHHEG